jgi:hypothetical protein
VAFVLFTFCCWRVGPFFMGPLAFGALAGCAVCGLSGVLLHVLF